MVHFNSDTRTRAILTRVIRHLGIRSDHRSGREKPIAVNAGQEKPRAKSLDLSYEEATGFENSWDVPVIEVDQEELKRRWRELWVEAKRRDPGMEVRRRKNDIAFDYENSEYCHFINVNQTQHGYEQGSKVYHEANLT